MPTGRPSKYNPKTMPKLAKKLCATGMTEAELAESFNVSLATLKTWKGKHPEFLAALKAGKAESDDLVERSLYERAMGYSHPDEKIFLPAGAKKPVIVKTVKHYPPDTTAAIFWLKNRRPKQWRDKQEHEHSGPDGGPIQTEDITPLDRINSRLASLASRETEESDTSGSDA